MDTINMNEAQLRASINRGAGFNTFTPDQARTSNIPVLNAQIEQGTSASQAYQLAMARAVATRASPPSSTDWRRASTNLKGRISKQPPRRRRSTLSPSSA
jgi:hypothetical protein